MDPEWIPILIIVLTITLTVGWLVNRHDQDPAGLSSGRRRRA